MSEKKQSKFDIWWNSPVAKRALGAAYSLGASVVIIGAMFKILHLPGAAQMLGIGMSCEAVLFALGIFDQPHKDYDWERIYDFDGTGDGISATSSFGSTGGTPLITATAKVAETPARTVNAVSVLSTGLNGAESIKDEDLQKLTEGIRNLTHTAEQFAGLSDVFGSTEQFAKNIDGASTNVVNASEQFSKDINGLSTSVVGASEQFVKNIDGVSTNVVGASEKFAKNIDGVTSSVVGASEQFVKNINGASTNVVGSTELYVKNIDSASQATGKFLKIQESLNGTAGLLSSSYHDLKEGMEPIEKNTKLYAGKVEEINKNLSSINSIYEIQLKNIQAQSEGLTQQTERVRIVTDELNVIVGDVQKMRSATMVAAEETESFKSGTAKLSKQVADLNQVYGNMLNALS
jgi:gliding motility-associated protein GldL